LTAIRAAWLFDGKDSALIADPLGVVDGSTIRSVEPGGAPPGGAVLAPASVQSGIPGFLRWSQHLIL
jgi:hypothetical protein